MKKPTTKKRSRTNWARIDALKNSEIDNSDILEQGKAFFKRAVLRLPEPKTAVTIRLDRQVLEWFKSVAFLHRRNLMQNVLPQYAQRSL